MWSAGFWRGDLTESSQASSRASSPTAYRRPWVFAITAPVLFHVQWDDEVFPRAGQLELFAALASGGKCLFARSGRHAQTHPDDETSWQEFIAR